MLARSSNAPLQVGPLEILPAQHVARAGGRTVPLSIQELSVLTALARRADQVLRREELFFEAWGRQMRPADRSVDVYVRRLRVKLERTLPGWRFIHTHFGLGYRLAPERSQAATRSEPSELDLNPRRRH